MKVRGERTMRALAGMLCAAATVAMCSCGMTAVTTGNATGQGDNPTGVAQVQVDDGSGDTPGATSGDTGQSAAQGAADLATTVLDTLPVKGRAPKTGYSRDQFGDAWSDVDHNGCDTRNDILKRDMTNVTFKDGTHDCVVLTGVLNDPYTGTVIHFQRGQDTSTAVQIDHVVALSNAWQTGAQQISADQRLQLANDPYNLLAVDGPANQQKSDGDAATWLPANKSFRCEYVARQIGVKAKYSLWVTDSEKAAMQTVLSSCPTQTVPTGGGVSGNTSGGSGETTGETTEPVETATETTEPTAEDTTTADSSDDSGEVTYANCAAVRAAGKAPLHAGDPGYSTKLDRDGDGTACE